MTSTFSRFFTQRGKIVRKAGVLPGGKRGTQPTEFFIMCTPVTGATDDEARRQIRREKLRTPMEIGLIFAGSSTMEFVRKGDDFVLGGKTYSIRHAELWDFAREKCARIILEKVD